MASSSSSIASGRGRLANMRPYEDIVVCEEYVKATLDIENGTCQNIAKVWNTIEVAYNARSDIQISREGHSLQSRYSKISRDVSLWVSKLSETYSEFRSGTNENDWIEKARTLYAQANEGKAFNHDKCYQALKTLPKYQINTTARMNVTPTIPTYEESFQTPSPSTPITPVAETYNLEDNTPIDIEAPMQRPPGRKGEKERQKRKARNSIVSTNNAMIEKWDKFNDKYVDNSAHARQHRDNFDINFNTMVRARERELAILEKREEDAKRARDRELAILEKKEDDAILYRDISHLNANQIAVWNMSVQEILGKRANARNSESTSSLNYQFMH